MTTTLNGQLIGQAQAATRAMLDELLASTETPFHRWVTLNLLATAGGRQARDALVERMHHGLKIDRAAAVAAVDETVATGFAELDDQQHVTITPQGDTCFRRVRDGVDSITERLYADLPAADVAAAARVLTIVTERANTAITR